MKGNEMKPMNKALMAEMPNTVIAEDSQSVASYLSASGDHRRIVKHDKGRGLVHLRMTNDEIMRFKDHCQDITIQKTA